MDSSGQREAAALLYWCHRQLAKERRTSTKGQQEAGDSQDTVTEDARVELEPFTPTSRVM